MKISWSWLQTFVELPVACDAEKAAVTLTALGLEVEDIATVGQGIPGCVVAEVVAVSPHPSADNLTLVTVTDGRVTKEVVCGASNVPQTGGRVVWAKPETSLPKGLTLQTRKVRGVTSFGMLCALEELNLAESSGGICILDAQSEVGENAMAALGAPDIIFDIAAPANRGDVVSHLGCARELVAKLGGRLVSPPRPKGGGESGSSPLTLRIEDPSLCHRYTARVLGDVTVSPSPNFVQVRLHHLGVRAISNVVDATNYVLLEIGQPLHAFDQRFVDELGVRYAVAGEKLQTLDGEDQDLLPSDMVIATSKGPVAVAGVMGGQSSQVTESTSAIVVESASFSSHRVRKTARRLGLHSESSLRFERGVDPNLAPLGQDRMLSLLEMWGGAIAKSPIHDLYPNPISPAAVCLRTKRLSALAGVPIDTDSAVLALQSLGMETSVTRPSPELDTESGAPKENIESPGTDTIVCTVPSYRQDISREIDLIEEVLRIRGFDIIPATLPATQILHADTLLPEYRLRQSLRESLVAQGVSEAITYGFCSVAAIENMGLGDTDRRTRPVVVQNPMNAGQKVMRTMILPNLLESVRKNKNAGEETVALFEVGSVFFPEQSLTELPVEKSRVCCVVTGTNQWMQDRHQLDFFDAKGILENAMKAIGVGITVGQSTTISYFHPGKQGEVVDDSGNIIGDIGCIHPEVAGLYDLGGRDILAWSVDLSGLALPPPQQMEAIHKFPTIQRDISFWIDEKTPAAAVDTLIAGFSNSILSSWEMKEDFRDPKYVPSGKKGMLWSIVYRHFERTLTDKEVDSSHTKLLKSLEERLGVARR